MTRKLAEHIERELRLQTAIPGTRLTEREKLQRLADKPLAYTKPQKPPAGLFDTDQRNQGNLF